MREPFRPVAKQIKDFANTYGYREKMAANRNSIIAHITTSFQDYYDSLYKFTKEIDLDLIIAFMKILQHLRDFLGLFVSQANKEWNEDGLRIDASIQGYLSKFETQFSPQDADTTEMIEIKRKLLLAINSIKDQLNPKSAK